MYVFSVTHLQMTVFKVHIVVINFYLLFFISQMPEVLCHCLYTKKYDLFLIACLVSLQHSSLASLCLLHILSVIGCSVVSSCLPPMDCSPPGSSFHGILQARILEWLAISFSSILRM